MVSTTDDIYGEDDDIRGKIIMKKNFVENFNYSKVYAFSHELT